MEEQTYAHPPDHKQIPGPPENLPVVSLYEEYEMTEKKYRPRFERIKGSTPSYRFQMDGDLPILQHLAVHRRLTIFQIQKLTARNIDSLRRRMRYLFQDGYVERRGRDYSSPALYSLSRKAKGILVEAGHDGQRLEWQLRNDRELSDIHRAHTLMLGDIRIGLEVATKKSEELELVEWEQGRHIHGSVETPEFGRVPIAPDAFFSVRKLGGGESVFYHFLLEADRSTETLQSRTGYRSLNQRYRGYFQFHREKGFAKWGIRAARILTITTSEQRRNNLTQLAQGADDRKSGSRLFLFAWYDDFQRDPLGRIWSCPADKGLHTLFD